MRINMMKAVRMAGSIATPIRPRILPHYERHYCPFSSMPTPALQKDAEYCRSLKRGLSLLHASLRPSGLFTQGYRPCYVRLGRLPRNCRAMSSATDIETSVGLLVEGNPKIDNTELNTLVEQLYEDAGLALQQATVVAMGILEGDEDSVVPGPLELSVVLCDDAHIQELNKEWRGVDSPTDVLSFEMGGDFDFEDDDEFLDDIQGEAELDNEEDVVVEDYEDDVRSEKLYEEAAAELDDDASNVTVSTDPAMILGDVVISIDTAKKQAEARGYTLRDECRILLIHGILHLLGYDHEHDIDEEAEMAAAESKILGNLGWAGSGLIAAAGGDTDTAIPPSSFLTKNPRNNLYSSQVRLLALDMDGTLLNSNSEILPSSVEAIRGAISKGVTVMLATGKARPAAMAALRKVKLAGDGLVVGMGTPGIFLQGLAVHGTGGQLIAGGELDPHVVRMAFEWAQSTGIAVCGFQGESCITTSMTPEVEELHYRYYEPLARVVPTVDDVLEQGLLRKLIFLASPSKVESSIGPEWATKLKETNAQTMQAVPSMLEIVPRGINKWVGMQALMDHLNLHVDDVMAIGDGSNDLELVANVGLGVAMGNAVPSVKTAAKLIVSSNDENGISEAIEQCILY